MFIIHIVFFRIPSPPTDSLGGLRFGTDGEGNYGYYKYDETVGADTLVPFKGGVTILASCKTGLTTVDVKSMYPERYTKFTVNDFHPIVTGFSVKSNSIGYIGGTRNASATNTGNATVTKTYDNNTGLLNINVPESSVISPSLTYWHFTNTSNGGGYERHIGASCSVAMVYDVCIVS